MRVRLLYFASLRDAAGCDSEEVDVGAGSLAELYEAARTRHGLPMTSDRLRVAMDGAFADWSAMPHVDAEIAFIPPVSGG